METSGAELTGEMSQHRNSQIGYISTHTLIADEEPHSFINYITPINYNEIGDPNGVYNNDERYRNYGMRSLFNINEAARSIQFNDEAGKSFREREYIGQRS